MSTLVNQNGSAPTRKMNFNLFGTQLAAVLLGIVAILYPEVYARFPAGFEASLGSMMGGILGYAFGYAAKEKLA